jgi:hypothetical protein
MAFPSSPTNGQVAVQNGISYTYNSTYKSWTRNPATLPTLSVYTGTFTGDGVTTSFTLSLTPVGADFISINIDGVSQLKSAYTLSTNIVTFTGIPDVGAVIEVKSWNAATVGVLTGLTFDSFTGNGTGTTYTLSTSPTNKNYTLVTVGGITQEKVNYSVSGTTLTFTTAPPNTSPIEVMTFGPAINSSTVLGGSNSHVQFNNNGALGGSSSLTFNNSTNTLTVGNLSVSGNSTFTGNVISSGIVGGNGSSLTSLTGANVTGQVGNALVAGTVYTAAQPNITSVGTLTSLAVTGALTYGLSVENLVALNGATGTVTHNVTLGATFYHTAPTANFTANFTNVSTTDSKATVVALVIVQGATPYIPTAMSIDGTTQTVKWNLGVSPTGTANKSDVISYTLIRVNTAWVVFGQTSYYG